MQNRKNIHIIKKKKYFGGCLVPMDPSFDYATGDNIIILHLSKENTLISYKLKALQYESTLDI